MNAALSSRDALMPRGPDRIGRGLMLALIVHVGLVIAIAIGVNWRSRAPEAMSAELWSAVPQAAAPRMTEPEPTPTPTPPTPPKPVPAPPKPVPVPKVEPPPVRETPDAQIAIEKAKREKERKKQLEEEEAQREKAEQRKKDQAAAEKQQQELDRKKKAEEDKREAERKKAEDARVAKQRDENMKRMMSQAGANGEPTSAGTAKRSSGPSANYAGRVQARVMPNIVFPDESAPGNPIAEFEVRASPDGTIIGAPRLTKSSGVPSWDEAALRAIIKTAVLPRDTDGTVPSPLIIALKPRF